MYRDGTVLSFHTEIMISKVVIAAIACVAIVAIIIGSLYGMYFSGYNAAQAKDENVIKLAADVDAQLQRRYDLIPNLVESVRG
jgi:LemA protein